MAASNAALDPLQALAAALAVPADSPEQATLLESLRDALETQQNRIPILCTTLVKTIAGAGDSLLKRWVLDLLHFGLARSALPLETRTELAGQSLDTLAGLLNDSNPTTVKIVIQCFATIYPLLFRLYCTNRNLRSKWEVLVHSKAHIFELLWTSSTRSGIRLASLKFAQRVVLVQTRGVSDPRLQNKADPNLALCPSDHPFLFAGQLESEGAALLERLITLLFQSRDPALLSALLNSWSSLARLRPLLLPLIVSTLATWTPRELAGLPPSRVRSVEKALRILLLHISRGPQGTQHAHQVQDALQQQALRMEQADRVRRDAVDNSRKRPLPNNENDSPDTKRPKLTHSTDGPSGADALAAVLASFDFTALPVGLVADVVVANLRAMSEQTLNTAIEAYRESQAKLATPAPQAPVTSTGAVPPPVPIKEEPVDPLQMDIDEDDIEYEPDLLNDQFGDFDPPTSLNMTADAPPLALVNFQLPPPKHFSEGVRRAAVHNAVSRIQDGAQTMAASTQIPKTLVGMPATDMWMLLLVRMITRAQSDEAMEDDGNVKGEAAKTEGSMGSTDQQNDDLRRTLCDYVLADFSARMRLATVWMNEEWYNDRIRTKQSLGWQPRYDIWLHKIVSAHQENLNARDRTFSQFLLDLPALPDEILSLLREFCTDPEKTQVGFLTLREFVTLRPPLRAPALDILLELTTHPAKTIRTPAINTVKRWVPDVQPMYGIVQKFALRLLRRLQRRSAPDTKQDQAEEAPEDGMEDGQLPQDEVLQTMYLPEEVTLPADKAQVLQHVELLFALSVRLPDLLDELFAAYGQMDVSVQQAIQELITALIRSLGPTHGKLLTLLRTFPHGAETLALRVLTIFTENGRPHPTVVALVKALIAERDLDARFLIPIIAEMDKTDILRHLPRIVSMLNGQPEPKNLVRSVFGAIVTTPPQTFGSVTSNLPRVRQSELLTPAELMVLLHESEKEIGLNSAKEAIAICFSMTDVYRSEILAVVMQQIMDEPVIPLLFMRTVIQSVQTYKSLVGFVSTTLLSRLITKKIWTNHALWQGFIHCAKAIAPASFGALLQLPKDQLRELVDKQPGLKSGLREYVIKKAGNKARVASFLEVFGEGVGGGGTPPQGINVSPPPA